MSGLPSSSRGIDAAPVAVARDAAGCEGDAAWPCAAEDEIRRRAAANRPAETGVMRMCAFSLDAGVSSRPFAGGGRCELDAGWFEEASPGRGDRSDAGWSELARGRCEVLPLVGPGSL